MILSGEMMKVAGAVILYNPQESVLNNIDSYTSGLDVLYVIDNSEFKNEALVEKIQKNLKCRYLDNKTNQGIAQALNRSAKLALQEGCFWLLTMDQDSRFEDDNFAKLLDFTKKQDDKKIGLVSPLHNSAIFIKQEKEVDAVMLTMTSGNFISLYSYEKIGGFDERFFIDAVDWDYCLRLNIEGFKVLRLNSAVLEHGLGNHPKKYKSFFGKERVILNYNPIRRYYITRNKLLMSKLYFKNYPQMSVRWAVSLLADLRNILLYEENKMQKIKSMLLGIKDFFLNRLGKKDFTSFGLGDEK
ncbi:glycosyltransferase [bacterium]|nr:glycosyltransferase [bacterium]MBU1995143.1 glycosyltransferase [bacterium]